MSYKPNKDKLSGNAVSSVSGAAMRGLESELRRLDSAFSSQELSAYGPEQDALIARLETIMQMQRDLAVAQTAQGKAKTPQEVAEFAERLRKLAEEVSATNAAAEASLKV